MIRDALPVGVVVERRASDHPWQDHIWRVVAVIPGAPEVVDWTELGRGDGWVRYHAATLPVELFSSDTEAYKYNLEFEPPLVFIVLDPDEEGDHEVVPVIATVSPYEAQDYLDAPERLVESVAMPPAMRAWVAEFVAAHHVEKPFRKRKQSPQKPAEGPANELILPVGHPHRRRRV
jgi:hypothetical protein